MWSAWQCVSIDKTGFRFKERMIWEVKSVNIVFVSKKQNESRRAERGLVCVCMGWRAWISLADVTSTGSMMTQSRDATSNTM